MSDGAGERQDQELNDDFGLSALREVLRLISESDISEIKIERGGSKLHIRRGQSQAPHAAAAPFLVTPSLAAAMPQHHLHSPLPPVAKLPTARTFLLVLSLKTILPLDESSRIIRLPARLR